MFSEPINSLTVMNNACFINTDVPIAQSDKMTGLSGSRYLLYLIQTSTKNNTGIQPSLKPFGFSSKLNHCLRLICKTKVLFHYYFSHSDVFSILVAFVAAKLSGKGPKQRDIKAKCGATIVLSKVSESTMLSETLKSGMWLVNMLLLCPLMKH